MARFLVLILGACALSSAVALKTHNATKPAHVPTEADVKKLHEKLAVLAANLGGMLGAKDGVLAHSKLAPTMELFAKELTNVLKETSTIKDPVVAYQKLSAAKAGIAGLTSELTHRQEDIMKEDVAQKESLLLGVLMTRKKAPMEEQIEILENEDFADLPVAQALLEKHDDKTPLFVQAAEYLDKHKNEKVTGHKIIAKPNTETIALSLEKRVKSLEEEYASHEARHKKLMAGLKPKKHASAAEEHTVNMMKKREERNFKKWAAIRQHDIKTMKMAVDAVKRGDMAELKKAQDALQSSMKAMQSQNSGFLVLLQQSNEMLERDCPYCAAQCVDKCHSEGKPYIQCMTDCADAGKN